MAALSRSYLAAQVARCRCLPVPVASGEGSDGEAFVDMPTVLASWSEDAKQHILTVGDVRAAADTHEMLQFVPKLTVQHPGAATDLQVARIDETLLAATCSSSGGVCLLMMQLPPVPAATCADLQFVLPPPADDGSDAEDDGQGGSSSSSYLQELPDLHDGSISSLDINTTRQSLLTVAADGSICIVPLDAVAAAGGECSFRAASGWAGFSQGRWIDSSAFATTGVLGGVQVWDTRRGPQPVSKSPLSWGHTGCAALDRQHGAARQLLCLDVHPSRPNLAATGASGGSVALWDLRFSSEPLCVTGSAQASGDVWELKFDPCQPLMSSAVAAVPPLLYCTSDGALCSAQPAPQQGGQLASQVLLRDSCSINSFDVEPAAGLDVLAVTDHECMLLLHRDVEEA